MANMAHHRWSVVAEIHRFSELKSFHDLFKKVNLVRHLIWALSKSHHFLVMISTVDSHLMRKQKQYIVLGYKLELTMAIVD